MNPYNLNKRLKELTIESFEKAEDRGISIDTIANGEADAFRHVYSSAVITREEGDRTARILGTVNEIIHRNTGAERYMDEYNNAIGRELGRRAIEENWDNEKLADEVKTAIDKGYVIINTESVTKKNIDENPYFIPESNPNLQFPSDYSKNQEKEKGTKNPKGPTHASGPIFVHPYARRNGEVKAHSRSRPDESLENNLGTQKGQAQRGNGRLVESKPKKEIRLEDIFKN